MNDLNNTPESYILFVEDNPDDEALVLRVFRKHRMADNVVVVRDGAEALGYLQQTPVLPRFVLLDIRLPRMSGLEVLQGIRQTPRTHHLPVVILTSSNEPSDIMTSYQLGANSFITKPVDFETFENTVYQMGVYWLHYNQPPVNP